MFCSFLVLPCTVRIVTFSGFFWATWLHHCQFETNCGGKYLRCGNQWMLQINFPSSSYLLDLIKCWPAHHCLALNEKGIFLPSPTTHVLKPNLRGLGRAKIWGNSWPIVCMIFIDLKIDYNSCSGQNNAPPQDVHVLSLNLGTCFLTWVRGLRSQVELGLLINWPWNSVSCNIQVPNIITAVLKIGRGR